jgi:O-antigen biosynthesis protein
MSILPRRRIDLVPIALEAMQEMPTRYFIASGCSIATTTLYRCVHFREQLRDLGYRADLAEWFDEGSIDPSQALNYDVLFLYRLAMCPPLGRLIERARHAGKLVIFDTDDLVFEPELLEWHRAVHQLSAAEQKLHAQGVQRYLTALRVCDMATTATPVLAKLVQRRGTPAFVHRNALGKEMLAVADRLCAQRPSQPRGDKIIIGYGSGTATNDVDFREATAALLDGLNRFPQAELWIAGPLTLPPSLENFGERVRRFPTTDWRGWFELMSQMDVVLAPLEIDNIFCRAKSEIKFVEAGALGVPVVASEVDSFKDVINQGENGFLAADENGWKTALRAVIEQPQLRTQMGERARRTVLDRYSPQARTADLAALLPQLVNAASRTRLTTESSDRSVIDQSRSAVSIGRELPRPSASSLVMNWLIPEPFPGAGGDTAIFRIIRHLAEFGHDIRVYVVPYNLMNNYSTERIRDYVGKHFGPTPARYYRWSGYVDDADCTFATFWPTALELLALPNGGQRYYLVQDFEPFFYPAGSPPCLAAENTYRAGLHCITLGPWLAKLLRERYQAMADHFDYAVDTDIYWPRPGLRDDQRQRLCFYARPATPRRAYELGLEALQLVKARLPELEIVFYGAEELTPSPSFPFVNRGLLKQDGLAALFSSCDVGLVFSLTNPSFVPLEMMACGCVVIEIASERLEGVLTHGQDAWLVEPTPQAVADGVVQLLEEKQLRERLVENGYARTKTMPWSQSVRQIEAVLLHHASNK